MSKVLVIHNDLEMQETLLAFFRQKGFEIVGYADVEKALTDLEKTRIKADAIVTDLALPEMTGIDFIKRLRESNNTTPVILVTSDKSVETAMEAIQAGAYDFVVKPVNFHQLLISVERALHFRKLQSENETLKTVIKTKEGTCIDSVVGRSPGFVRALDLAKRVSKSSTNIMVTGESGTGKEVIARTIHNLSARANSPFVAINCSAIPENLLESELFGYAKGAFTGAVDKKLGLLEEADGGTLFLDEVGDMNLPLQAKLLRVLQERKIKRVGENQMRGIDVRIISATHKDLKKEILDGNFREDLFFRLNVIHIRIPPLRDRKEDILPLAEFFMQKYAALNRCKVKAFSKEALEKLLSCSWQGNVRELENTIERAVVLCNSEVINISDLQDFEEDFEPGDRADFDIRQFASDKPLTADKMMKLYIRYVLERNNGAKEKTARDLNIDRKTLYRKLQEMEFESLVDNRPQRRTPTAPNKFVSLQ
jgi:two-component system response regulator HydG